MKGLIITMDRTALQTETDFFAKRLIKGKKRMIIALAVYFLLSTLTLYQKFRRDGFTLMNISMTILILAIIYEAWKGQKIAVAILVGTSVSSAVQCILVAFAANGIVIGVALALLIPLILILKLLIFDEYVQEFVEDQHKNDMNRKELS